MPKRTMLIVAPEGFGVTVDSISKKMNQRFDEIKMNNPKGFMDQFEQQFDGICWDIAQEKNGKFDRKEIVVDGVYEEQLMFCYNVSIETAYNMTA